MRLTVRTAAAAAAVVAVAVAALALSAAGAAVVHQAAPSETPSPSERSQPDDSGPLLSYIRGWWVVGITVASAFPWAVVAVLDAIDASYRSADVIVARLLLSTACLVLAYASGLMFVIVLMINILYHGEEGRHDEVATVLVLLIFNLWHVGRNIRGWLQYFALRKLRPFFETLQRNLANSVPPPPGAPRQSQVCVQGLLRLRISNRLIDNDWNKETPFLNPLYPTRAVAEATGSRPWRGVRGDPNFGKGQRKKSYNSLAELAATSMGYTREVWAVAAWRAWWTQDTSVGTSQVNDLTAPASFAEQRQLLADGLLRREKGPYWPTEFKVCDEMTPDRPEITTREQWAECLTKYGENGQQDTLSEALPRVMNFSDASGVATVVHEKTRYPPNRMSALWYNTAKFEEVYEEKSQEVRMSADFGSLGLPRWSSWQKIAQDIGTHLSRPVYLSDVHLVNFAGELAAASLIMARYPSKYCALVEQIYEDGLNSRWTFGWSGLLACFSHLWTAERIHVAMLNGLSLLALAKTERVEDMDGNVRSMMYGYAAFAVSDRAVGKRVAQERKAELLKRYRLNRGRTCRGSGVCATRLACEWLGLPAEASHMDGLPAFATGWASEYMERMPGNHPPDHGDSHDDVEMRHGSSNVWRYPHSHT